MTEGYHGPKSIDALATWAKNRPKHNQQAVIVVTGETGTGKSGFSLMFAKKVYPKFDPRKNVVRSSAEWDLLRKILEPGGVILDDEAIGSGSNRMRTMAGENNDKTVDINRKRKLCHIILSLIPYVDDYDKKQLKHAHWWVKLTSPGEGIVFEVQRRGLLKTYIWVEPRFPFSFPECEKAHPELWIPYKQDADASERGQQRRTIVDEARIKRYEDLAQALFPGLLEG